LEGVHESAVKIFAEYGYTDIEVLPSSLGHNELIARLQGVHLLGIRSRTQISDRTLASAEQLIAIGCFCTGTDQVDLAAARQRGIPVFNAPFANTRSVAELVMGEIIMLMRGIFPKSQATHQGSWDKSSFNSFEVRGKTLGIVGYGNVGSQLGVLAEAFGMDVVYYDVVNKLPIGNSRAAGSLDLLLAEADVVSLHVPETPVTVRMIGACEIRAMQKGAFLINASRGAIVDLDALAKAIHDGHLSGAAVDVFPNEPMQNSENFVSPLRRLSNVILTPHIGGSTREAQQRIGVEVADKLARYSKVGRSIGAVNLPQARLDLSPGIRLTHLYRNRPETPRQMIKVLTNHKACVAAQYVETDSELAYSAVDLVGDLDLKRILMDLQAIPGMVRTRYLYNS
jgi:D-3-phosphoglycerate dehydrogenase